mgnify:CR=1 FL=1
MGATPVEMYKLFFGSQAMCPYLTEDAGLSCNRPDTQVSSPVPGHVIHIFTIKLPLKELSFKHEWFYITAPRGTRWVAPPAFRSGPPQRLASWVNKGLDWGPSKDVPLLQGRIRDLQERERSIWS